LSLTEQNIIDAVKELYLSCLSYQQIIDKVKAQYKKTLSKGSISGWSKKYGWESLKKEAALKGVSAAISESSDIEEDLKKQISDKYHKRYSKNEKLGKLCVEYIERQFGNEDIDPVRLKAVASTLSVVNMELHKLESLIKTDGTKDVGDTNFIVLS